LHQLRGQIDSALIEAVDDNALWRPAPPEHCITTPAGHAGTSVAPVTLWYL